MDIVTGLLIFAGWMLALGLLAWAGDRYYKARTRVGRWTFQDLETLTWEQRVAFLRHPAHRPRCACGRYWCADWVVRDDDAMHAEDRCQPGREAL